MGIASLGGILSGAGDVSSPGSKGPGKDFAGLLRAFLGGSGDVFNNQATYQPQYEQLGVTGMGNQAPTIAKILSGLATGAGDTVRSISPGQTSLLSSLTKSAGDQLDAGASLDPQLQRLFQQSQRGAEASRGMGRGPSDVFNESLGLTSFGNDLRTQREQFAGGVAGMNNQFETVPALQQLNTILAQYNANKGGAGPSLAPPAMTSQFLTVPYQGRLQAAGQTAANNTGLYQSMDSNQSSFIGGL